MMLSLSRDSTLNVDISRLCRAMRRAAPLMPIRPFDVVIDIPGEVVGPATSIGFQSVAGSPALDDELLVLFTAKPYYNNFFWELDESTGVVVVSLYGWEYLSTLPQENGVALFTCAILLALEGLRYGHDENTGCVNDFWLDKTGVHSSLLAGYVCTRCRDWLIQEPSARATLEAITPVLEDVSSASRNGTTVIDLWESRTSLPKTFDVFLCHNSRDKPQVRVLASGLRDRGIEPWLDEEQLRPGLPWQPALEEQIAGIKSAAVCVGPNGQGPWQDLELQAFIREFVRRRCPVIPVALTTLNSDFPVLPVFLSGFVWVDLREKDAMARLEWGITGHAPHSAD